MVISYDIIPFIYYNLHQFTAFLIWISLIPIFASQMAKIWLGRGGFLSCRTCTCRSLEAYDCGVEVPSTSKYHQAVLYWYVISTYSWKIDLRHHCISLTLFSQVDITRPSSCQQCSVSWYGGMIELKALRPERCFVITMPRISCLTVFHVGKSRSLSDLPRHTTGSSALGLSTPSKGLKTNGPLPASWKKNKPFDVTFRIFSQIVRLQVTSVSPITMLFHDGMLRNAWSPQQWRVKEQQSDSCSHRRHLSICRIQSHI